MDVLFKYLESVGPLSPGLRECLTLTVKTRTLRKKDFLLRAGRICDHVYFIEKGLVRCFYTEEDKQVSYLFVKDEDVIIADGFCEQIPSRAGIQAIENSSVYYISHRELNAIFQLFPEFNLVGRLLMQKQRRFALDYVYNTNLKSAHDRYQYFINNFPELVNRVPWQMVASFLSMTPVWLSEIRSKLRFIKMLSL